MKEIYSELFNFIKFVDSLHQAVSSSWHDERDDDPMNYKSVQLFDIIAVKEKNVGIRTKFLMDVQQYSSFLTELFLINQLKYVVKDDALKDEIRITQRTKHHNSVISKVITYRVLRKEQGKVSINKCLNDLLGYRIILPTSFFNSQSRDYILEILTKYCGDFCESTCKARDASKSTDEGTYRAIHINFSFNNYCFPWEVQIWSNDDVKPNFDLHAIHKQSYLEWEMSNSTLTVD